jgi:hypothetical protein
VYLYCVRVLNGRILAASEDTVAYSTDPGDPYTLSTVANPSSGTPIDAAVGADGSIHMLSNPGAAAGEIWRSANGGATWADVSPASMDDLIYDLAIVAGVGDELVVMTADGGATDYNAAYSVNGITWARVTGLITVSANGPLGLAYDPDGDRYIAAVTDDTSAQLFVSDAATSVATAGWTEKTAFQTAWNAAGFTQPPYRAACSPAGAIMVACSAGTCYSSDDGASWTTVAISGQIIPTHSLFWSARLGAFVMSANNDSSEGVVKSYNSGSHTWSDITTSPSATYITFGSAAEFPQP